MRLSEKIRRNIFWQIDMLRGSPVKRHLEDLYKFHSSDNPEHQNDEVGKRLFAALDKACRYTKFYKGLNPNDGLAAFPVVDKDIIRANFGELLSSRYAAKDLFQMVTSGSTGTPFKTLQSLAKKLRNTADTLFFAGLGGYCLGNKLYYLKIWNDINRKSRVMQIMQNVVPVDVMDLRGKAKTIAERLSSCHAGTCLLGYASAVEAICRAWEENDMSRINFPLQSVITMSEGLNDYTKKTGERLFGCPVLSRYSNMENGIIGQQTIADKANFLINEASYLVEILDVGTDERMPNGALGRIVVTDYFNDAMPMIRYDTGDLGVIEKVSREGNDQMVLSRVEGRRLDQIFDTNGKHVSSYVVVNNMWKYGEIEQFQFVQQGDREYLFKISGSGRFFRERELVEEFKEYLGQDARIAVKYVDEIPILASGKRKQTVNEMNVAS